MSTKSSDPRTRRSRSALEAALLELIVDTDLAQISISAVTRRADVNRSTFYEHYRDLEDLAASACTGLFDELVDAVPVALRSEEARVALTGLFAHVAEHAHLYRRLLGDDGSARVINHLLERMATGARVRRGIKADAHDPMAAFIAGAVLGTITDWVRRHCPGTPDEMAAVVWSGLSRPCSPA